MVNEVRRDELFGESILQRLGREDVDDVTKVVALPEEVVLGVNQLLLARPILLNFLAVTNNTINALYERHFFGSWVGALV